MQDSSAQHDPWTDPVRMDPVDILAEDADPVLRSRAHAELARRAAARNDVDQATLHYREAFDLDPTDETPIEALHSLGVTAQPREDPEQRRSAFARWLHGLRRTAH